MLIKIDLTIPLIMKSEKGGMPSLTIIPDFELRIKDTTKIINRILDRWDNYVEKFEKFAEDEEARLTYIETIFSFIIFYLLLIKFYIGLHMEIEKLFKELDILKEYVAFPRANKIVRKLITIRNKMIGHVCFNEPRQEDTIADQLAYLMWQVNIDSNLDFAKLNMMSLRVGDISSKHIILPPLSKIIEECNKYIKDIDISIKRKCEIIKERLKMPIERQVKYFIIEK